MEDLDGLKGSQNGSTKEEMDVAIEEQQTGFKDE
jgi:hypothetical protein